MLSTMSTVSRTKRISDIMTAEQTAALLGISIATLWRWRNQGILTAKRVLGRTVFDRSAVEAEARRRRAMAAG
jgi:predicted site-specific integrase-resolvase